MTDRELMQQALDAATEELPKVDERETVFCSIQGHHLRALCEFVRAALTQPEPEPVAWMYNGNLHEFDPSDWAEGEVIPLYTATPQQEEGCSECGKKQSDGWALYCVKCIEAVQEPIGWVYEDDEGRMMFSQMPHPDPLWEPVYRAKREWVGLTDEETENFTRALWPRQATAKDFIRAIEAKLKEKNT